MCSGIFVLGRGVLGLRGSRLQVAESLFLFTEKPVCTGRHGTSSFCSVGSFQKPTECAVKAFVPGRRYPHSISEGHTVRWHISHGVARSSPEGNLGLDATKPLIVYS